MKKTPTKKEEKYKLKEPYLVIMVIVSVIIAYYFCTIL